MSAPGCSENVTISKCPCGDRMCSSYRLSNQGSVGFELADAHQMAASGKLYDALEDVMGWIANWSPDFTQDDEWAATSAKVAAALAKARGQ